MKFSTREDLEVPVDAVWDMFTDVAHWERLARRRGVTLARLDQLTEFEPGMIWDVGFTLRGKTRQLELRLAGVEPRQRLVFAGTSANFDVTVTLDFVALSPRRSRVIAGSEIRPRNLGARVVLQSLKLARARIDAKYEARVAHLCNEIEGRFRAQV